MTLHAITLDVGNTLLFPHPSLGDVYAEVAGRHGLSIDPEDTETAFRREWSRGQEETDGLVYGTTHEEALRFWYRVNRAMFSSEVLSDRSLHAFVDDLYEVFGRSSAWRVNSHLQAVLDAAAAAGIRVGLISNWDVRLRPLLRELSFTEWASPVLISAEAGFEKPHPKLFRMALRLLDAPPEAVLHVGDTWEDDVLAAKTCGMQAAWFNPDRRPLPENSDHVADLSSLAELTTLMTGT